MHYRELIPISPVPGINTSSMRGACKSCVHVGIVPQLQIWQGTTCLCMPAGTYHHHDVMITAPCLGVRHPCPRPKTILHATTNKIIHSRTHFIRKQHASLYGTYHMAHQAHACSQMHLRYTGSCPHNLNQPQSLAYKQCLARR